MTLSELYVCADGSYEDAKNRLMTDRLVEKFALRFPADPTMSALAKAVAEGSIEDSFIAAHTLRGVAANLAFTALSEAAGILTEQLRPRSEHADPGLYAAVNAAYEKVIRAINAYQA